MISSAPRLKVFAEFVTYASLTLSSTPDSVNRITSESAGLGLMLAGSGFSDEAKRTSPADPSDSSLSSHAAVISSRAGTDWKASADSLVASVTFSGAFDFRHPPPASDNKIKADPILHFQGIRLFISAIMGNAS